MANSCCVWIKSIVVILAYLVFPIANSEIKRNLSLKLNPNCDEYQECTSSNVSIFYIEAIGPNDTIHYLWSTRGIPSALIVQTNLNAQLQINWTSLLSPNPNHAISFTENPLYAFGVLITKLLQFNDDSDTGSMSKHEECEAVNFSNVNWTTSSKIVNDSSHCSVTFQTSENSTGFLTNGAFYFQLSAFGRSSRDDKLPRLLHDANGNEIGIILDHLKTNNTKSRFALECVAVYNSEKENSVMFKTESNNLDDEFTPGVFSTIEVSTPTSNCSDLCSSYLFWKPIAYTAEDLSISHSTDVKIYDVTLSKNIPPESIISAYFEFDKVQISTWNVSFGMKKDGFYRSTNYTSWYLTIGLGTPPEDTPSLALILTIAFGFGAPFVCMIGGSIYMALRKFLKKEDDLLLSRESM